MKHRHHFEPESLAVVVLHWLDAPALHRLAPHRARLLEQLDTYVTRTRLERGADEIPIATGVLILEGRRPDCAPRPLFGRSQLQFGAG